MARPSISDLENPICDVKSMTQLVMLAVDTVLDSEKREADATGLKTFRLNSDQLDMVFDGLNRLWRHVQQLQAEFYLALNASA